MKALVLMAKMSSERLFVLYDDVLRRRSGLRSRGLGSLEVGSLCLKDAFVERFDSRLIGFDGPEARETILEGCRKSCQDLGCRLRNDELLGSSGLIFLWACTHGLDGW